jgi:hypothetical protein
MFHSDTPHVICVEHGGRIPALPLIEHNPLSSSQKKKKKKKSSTKAKWERIVLTMHACTHLVDDLNQTEKEMGELPH